MATKSLVSGMIKRLYVLDYGLFQVYENDRIIGIQGYLVQIEDDRNILIDTGFPAWYAIDPEGASREDNLGVFGRVLRLDQENLPPAQLARIGLTPADIDLLVMTHSDIDHVGDIAGFPQAPIIIGQAERALERPRYFGDRSPIPWPSQASYQLIDGDTPLCPGVTVLATPGHSPGHLSLLLRLPEIGAVLLTADAISRASEVEEGFAGAWDPVQAQASAERLLAVAKQEQATVIYGHDPAQWQTLRKAPEFYG